MRKLEETRDDFVGHVLSQFLQDEEEHRKAYAAPEVSVRSNSGIESSSKSFQRFQDGLKMLNNIKRKKLTLEQVMFERTREKESGAAELQAKQLQALKNMLRLEAEVASPLERELIEGERT